MIRGAHIADAESVADVYIRSRRLLASYAVSPHSDEEVRSWIRDHLIPQGRVFVAEREEDILGMMALSSTDQGSWIDQLYVDPNHVRLGVGSRLLEFAKRELDAPIFLYTFRQNVGARRFYERNGFRAIAFSDGDTNEEHCPDVLYCLRMNECRQPSER